MEGGRGEFALCNISTQPCLFSTPLSLLSDSLSFFPNASHREKCAGPIFAQKWCWDRQITYQYLSLASHAPNSHPPPVQLIDWLGKKLGPLSSDQGHTTHGLCATPPHTHNPSTLPPPLQRPPPPTISSSSSSFLSHTHDHMIAAHACITCGCVHSETYLDIGEDIDEVLKEQYTKTKKKIQGTIFSPTH